jgi:hypothetical protein
MHQPGATPQEAATLQLSGPSDRLNIGDIVTVVIKINGKFLISKTTDDDSWVPMARIGDYPSRHCAWELLTQLGLKDFVGQLSFLGTQVLQLLSGVRIVIK